MKNLETTFMGIRLDNPVILGASNISSNLDQLKRAEEKGVGAVVYKTLFEEQVQLENLQLDERLSQYEHIHAEITKTYPDIDFSDIDYHLTRLRKAKESLSVPLFASLNAINRESWISYAKMIEETGVDGIEINLYQTPVDFDRSGESVESEQIAIVNEIKHAVSIPVGVKLSSTTQTSSILPNGLTIQRLMPWYSSMHSFNPTSTSGEKHKKTFNLSQKGITKDIKVYRHVVRQHQRRYLQQPGNLHRRRCGEADPVGSDHGTGCQFGLQAWHGKDCRDQEECCGVDATEGVQQSG